MRIIQGILTAVLFLGYVILWEIKRRELRRSVGVEADVIYGAVRPIQKYFGVLERVMTLFVAALIVIHAFFSRHVPLAEPAGGMDDLRFAGIGFMIGIAGLALCRAAQKAMGKSWRVGIDEGSAPGLVTAGIYRYVRNPVYTGLFILCAGVWMINPTVLFSYWMIMFFIMMEFQVRCEEEYLEYRYGQAYREYAAGTKRYLPFLY